MNNESRKCSTAVLDAFCSLRVAVASAVLVTKASQLAGGVATVDVAVHVMQLLRVYLSHSGGDVRWPALQS